MVEAWTWVDKRALLLLHDESLAEHGGLAGLRDEGLLEFRRGRGITVAGTPEQGAVIAQAKALVEFARRQGYRVDELVEIIQTVG